MQELLRMYMTGYVPTEVWEGAVIIALLIGGIGLYLRRRRRDVRAFVATALLAEYAVLILCTTLFYRYVSQRSELLWPPMWSYLTAYGGGTANHYIANGLNVLLFVPFGALYRWAIRRSRWWTMLIVAASFSFSIEVTQLILHIGYCEIDDFVHNNLGALIGYGIAALISRTIVINKKKRQSVVSEELPADNNK